MRITPVTKPYEPDVAEALKKMMPPNSGVEPLELFRILATHSRLGRRMTSLGGVFLRSEQLSLRERELIVLRTTALSRCEYEWGVHVTWLASPAGLTDQDVAATWSEDTSSHFAGKDALVIRLVDELHAASTVSDELWSELADEWGEPALVELVALVGFYKLISFVANATGARPEAWAARFPG